MQTTIFKETFNSLLIIKSFGSAKINTEKNKNSIRNGKSKNTIWSINFWKAYGFIFSIFFFKLIL